MAQTSFPVTPAAPRAPGPSLAASLIVIGLGVVIAVASAIVIAIPLFGTFASSTYVVPGDLHLHLRGVRYTVYQHTGTRSPFGSTTRDPVAIRILATQLAVIAPDGSQVPVYSDSNDETVTRSSDVYTGSLQFEAPVGGDYVLRFTNPTRTSVIVARSLTDAIQSVWVWFGTGALGGAVLIGGVVMLIVGFTRRGRAKRAMYAGWGYPGWPPPPSYGPQGYGPQGYGPQAYGPPAAYPPSPDAPPNDPWAPRWSSYANS